MFHDRRCLINTAACSVVLVLSFRSQVLSLIEGNANIDTADASGSTALHWASRHSADRCVEALLKASCEILQNNHGKTALDLVRINTRPFPVFPPPPPFFITDRNYIQQI